MAAWLMPAIMGLGLVMDLIGGVTGDQAQKKATDEENKREDQYNSRNADYAMQFMNMLGQPIGVPGQPGLNDPSAFQPQPNMGDQGTMGANTAQMGGVEGLLAPALAAATMQQQQGGGYNAAQMFEQNPQLMAMLQGGAMGGAGQMMGPQQQAGPDEMALAQMMGMGGGMMGAPQDGYSAGLMGLLQLLGGLSGQQGRQ